ncbi:substance-K receptor-like [Xenia sp. Carnegie-2017]|uniref:substance-K receptor-like n=1 Tax=Xenia sp. Carnegie-2017 TaxID=2897299 RepID=UPI001F04E24B|nr:substance-K receptor-like [Xenia sp. Carnegie-2017]
MIPTAIFVPSYESIIITMVLIFALLANGVLFFLFLRDHRMRTTTNFFVISHIVSEFFSSFQGLGISIYVLAQGGLASFVLEKCIFIGCENVFFFNTSFLSLTAIAVNRYLAVVKKVHHKITARKEKSEATSESRFLAWLVYCQESPGIFNDIDETRASVVLTIVINTLVIGVPILILLLCFYSILKSALSNRRQVNVSFNLHHFAADAYARSAFTTLLIITVYLICNAFVLPLIICPSIAESKLNSFFFRFFIWLRSATYPLVYIFRNPVYFRLLRRRVFRVYEYASQSCPCSLIGERTSHMKPKSPVPKVNGRIVLKSNKNSGTVSQGSHRQSPAPVSKQIRVFYLAKSKTAFTDLGSVEVRRWKVVEHNQTTRK